MHPKGADVMANSVDPDQTASSEAVWSWSALFVETYLSQYIEFVRYAEIGKTYPWIIFKFLLLSKALRKVRDYSNAHMNVMRHLTG